MIVICIEWRIVTLDAVSVSNLKATGSTHHGVKNTFSQARERLFDGLSAEWRENTTDKTIISCCHGICAILENMCNQLDKERDRERQRERERKRESPHFILK